MSSSAPAPRRPWQKQASARARQPDARLEILRLAFLLFAALIAVRLAVLQIADHATYAALAEGQHGLFRQLYPERGRVLLRDMKDGSVVPLALNQTLSFVYAEPRRVQEPEAAAAALAELLGYDETRHADLLRRLSLPDDPYEPIERHVSSETAERIAALNFAGIRLTDERARLYPDPSLGGHLSGFLGYAADGSLAGKYGVEGYFEKTLAGTPGSLTSQRDVSGRLIAVGERSVNPAVDGADVLLTVDRTIQFFACDALRRAVERHRADGGSVIILEPDTGRVLAMCGAPDFDPNAYRQVSDIAVFNNPVIFNAYEPGSIFKPVTMAAGIDAGAITPNTTYEDFGEVRVDDWTIRNSSPGARGRQTMIQALEESLNTGMVFAMRAMGKDTFADYVKRFGFGEKTGIELETESAGDIRPLDRRGEIFAATTSYGQGMTATPLQMAAAYVALANGGVLKRPYIVEEIRRSDGTVEKTRPMDVRRVIETKTANLVGAMLVSVIEHGHGGQAGVPGYYIAGKTGTAQVPQASGGYDPNKTIGSFAGFGPVEQPRFVMVTRIDHPKDVKWAESTAAPLFGEIAAFLVQYLEIPPTRPI